MPGTVLVVNPRSAGGRTEKDWPRLREVIHEAFGPFEHQFTEEAGHATRLAREALRGGADLVVAMGGDGTINEVANGFFDGDDKIAPGAALGVLPAGTGGDFRKTIGASKEIEQAAAQLKAATTRPIDIGKLTYVAHDGSTQKRYFINIASFGISGLVDQYVNKSSKTFGGTMTFALATLRAGMKYKNAVVRLTLDGTPREGKIYNVAVANGRYFGGGMKVAPDAALDDGWFDVITMGDFGFGDLLFRGLDIYSGKHLKNPKVSVHRARRVEAVPTDGAEVLLDVDGEQPGRLPATFELVAGGLRLRAAS
jgi:YegS/Rv2252/BmrU family lipid kinase